MWIKYWKKYWKLFCLGIFFLVIEAMCDLMQPTIMSKIIDIGVSQKNMDYVISKGIFMLVITGVGAVCAVLRCIIASHVSQKFGTDLRSDLFKKVNLFSFKNRDSFDTASLITRLTNDVTQIQNFVRGLMRILIKAPITGIGCIIMVSLLNKKLVFVLFIIIPIVFILIALSMKIGYPFFAKLQTALDKVNSIMREYLAGVRVVKAFNRFDYEVERFAKSNDELSDIGISASRIMAIFSPSITLLVNIGIIAVLWLGGSYVNKGEMQVGQIIAFTNYMTQLLFSLMMVSNVFNVFIRAKASSDRINEVLIQENTMINGTEQNSDVKGKIEFLNVSFSYLDNDNLNVLNNINFECSVGQTLGIIGSTGSGKTTLVNLIPRFYDISSGEIKVDGINVKNYKQNELRKKIAIVPQKNMLFTGTISDNIRWGKETATEEEIINVCKIAQAHEFINMFTDNYSTMLGQGGVNLSGGQKQRIAIARALLRNTEILILDDSTSAVDIETDAKIRNSLKQYSNNMTCIIITQRISSVINADNIIVLEQGTIVGQGTHNDLISKCQIYKDIYRSQIGNDERSEAI